MTVFVYDIIKQLTRFNWVYLDFITSYHVEYRDIALYGFRVRYNKKYELHRERLKLKV